jgi:hypothetical protein
VSGPRRTILVTFLVLAVLPAWRPAVGGGVRELEDAWLTPPDALAAVLDDQRAAPARWGVQLGQGALYGMPELPQTELAMGWRGGRFRASGRWQRLGRDLYREDLVAVEVRAGRRFQLGCRATWRRLTLGDSARSPAYGVDLVASVPLRPGLHMAIWWPLGAPAAWLEGRGIRRWLQLSATGPAAATLAVDRRADGVPLLQAEVMLPLVAGVALGLRTEPWSGTVGLITGWRVGSLTLRSSHLAHPDLGVTHRWGLLVGGGR